MAEELFLTTHLWTRLWAHELDPEDLPLGSVIAFVKAPRRAGEYGFVDALIAGLDRCPLTHAGIVTEAGPHPVLVHSTMAGLRREPLARAVPPHRHGPVFVFAHAVAAESTIHAVVDQAGVRAESADGRHDAYPLGDLLLAAVLLRLRLGSRFDEHRHHRLAGLFAQLVDPELSGRMCAAFVSEVFAEVGAPLELPEERSVFTLGLVQGYPAALPVPDWATALVSVGLADIANAAADGAARAGGLSAGARAETIDVLRGLANDPAEGERLAAWVVSAPVLGEPLPTSIDRLLSVLEDPRSEIPPPDGGLIRFSTVNDLIRSPHLVPLGHVIGWADELVPA